MTITETHVKIEQDRSNDRDTPEAVIRPGRQLPEHLSFSSLSTYSFCPAQWALGRLDGHKRPADETQAGRIIGSGTHEALDQMADGKSREDAIEAAMAEPEAANYRDEIEKMLDKSIAFEPSNPNRPSLRESEVHIEATLEGVPLVGKIDAIEMDDDDVVVISDYKTGKPPKSVNTDYEDDGRPVPEVIYPPKVTRQTVLYAEMAEATGRHIGRVRMIYPANGTVVEVDLDDARGKILRTEARRYLTYESDRLRRSIKTGVFSTSPSKNKCASCEHAEHCPATK